MLVISNQWVIHERYLLLFTLEFDFSLFLAAKFVGDTAVILYLTRNIMDNKDLFSTMDSYMIVYQPLARGMALQL